MAEPTSPRARSEVASALVRVTDDLTLLEALPAVLRHHDGSDQAVIEAAVPVKMAAGAIAPTAKAWQAEPDPAMVDVAGRTGRLLRSRLADGGAHLVTQAGQPRPCVAGQPPEAEGLHQAGPDTWTGAGTAFYWLADRGRLGAIACRPPSSPACSGPTTPSWPAAANGGCWPPWPARASSCPAPPVGPLIRSRSPAGDGAWPWSPSRSSSPRQPDTR
jgi:hypothetical protein